MENWDLYYLNQGYANEARERCKKIFRHLGLPARRCPLPNEPYYAVRRLRRRPRDEERTLLLCLASCLRGWKPGVAGVMMVRDRITLDQLKVLMTDPKEVDGVRMVCRGSQVSYFSDLNGIMVSATHVQDVLVKLRGCLRCKQEVDFLQWLVTEADVGVW